MTHPAVESFRAVCANEQFESAREMYPELAVALRALISSIEFATEAQAMLEQRPLREQVRAAYLVRLLLGRMSYAVGWSWQQWRRKHARLSACPQDQLTFFHADPPLPPGQLHDELAMQMGMKRGIDTRKLLQLLEHGIA
jgi:hypothetical protein